MRSLPIIATALLAATAPAFAMADPHAGHGDHGAHGAAPEGAIAAAVAAPTRTPANVARDAARHPTETLAFFGVKPGDTIIELWPGGGWYTEILAPLTQSGGGTLYAAAPWERGLNTIRKWQEAKPDAYGAVKLAEFPATGAGPKVPDGSADVVLTFRNVHNWRFGGMDKTAEAFQQIYAMLKPGGVLGVVDHRLPEAMDSALEEKSGYMKRSSIVAFAEAAGFKLAGESEVNANPRDTHDYEKGVWSLPPTLTNKDVDREKYVAIGESDRMTLKFVKPAS
ncbi:class I SAM-dependent methyltransferase [Sphingopyxis terrae]|uniref:Predicted methyltransferase n=1 Tax=Sphingopyxis terrae subsp. ummariensis TaxID=429001 RepID=A0A1Y6FPQ6_9SPHN|nr:methyltransferase domain-containing protein [Sphingopyxis terrae]PCF91680.1 methyltransferase type 11 [Sphingopyxis terrae subsp. ummariensis]SMQ76915.1 Predicted methyltransferase [Sphingopyxis terrae subsp. ummariensis]